MSKKTNLFLNMILLTTAISTPLYASDSAEQEELDFNDVKIEKSNPLLSHALKKNGKLKRKFKVPYSVLVEYYKYVNPDVIVENDKLQSLLDIDLEEIKNVNKEELEFFFDLKRMKAYPASLINPHSVSELFKLNPKAYIEKNDGEDFLTAKINSYEHQGYNQKKLRYERDFVQLEDWRSLNHPPIFDLGHDLTIWDKSYTPIDYEKTDSNFYKVDFQKRIDEISNTELTFGNKVELLENGVSYQTKIKEINKAKDSVLMAVMSIFCDKSSLDLEETLIRKAQEGVDVKVMVEKVWTKAAMKRCINRMRRGGVDVVFANDLLKKGEESALFHNKYMIIDSKTLIMGGSNIVESDNLSTGYNHMNRDNDVLITGPSVSDATLDYVELWNKYKKNRNERNIKNRPQTKEIEVYEAIAKEQVRVQRQDGLRGQESYESKLNDSIKRNEGVCRFITQRPDTDKFKLSKVFIEYMNNAENKINLTTGSLYFDLPEHDEKERSRDTYNKKFFKSVFAATERGVKLDIVGNGIDGGYGEASNMLNKIKAKNKFSFRPVQKLLLGIITQWLDKGAAKKNQPYLEYIQNLPNARAWAGFQYMHAKMMQLDRVVNVVSSYNLEEWSGDKSHESGIICMDKKLTHQMDRSFLKDFSNAVPAVVIK